MTQNRNTPAGSVHDEAEADGRVEDSGVEPLTSCMPSTINRFGVSARTSKTSAKQNRRRGRRDFCRSRRTSPLYANLRLVSGQISGQLLGSVEAIQSAIQEIRLELNDPTQQIRETVDCRASEQEVRAYLQCVVDQIEAGAGHT
jgi:hypothetical protein